MSTENTKRDLQDLDVVQISTNALQEEDGGLTLIYHAFCRDKTIWTRIDDGRGSDQWTRRDFQRRDTPDNIAQLQEKMRKYQK